ncbi:MAG: hypothetical protein KJ077_08400 [Anaerolineae bacterium]|nr:hypothetical protein [Anaerolineae bacterium]
MRSRTPEEQAEMEGLVSLLQQARRLRQNLEHVLSLLDERHRRIYHRAYSREKRRERKMIAKSNEFKDAGVW